MMETTSRKREARRAGWALKSWCPAPTQQSPNLACRTVLRGDRPLAENGMTPMQAILAATRTASECVQRAVGIGTLEAGKLADLLVVDGDPLSDISVLEDKSKLLMIMQGGRAHKDLITG